MMEMGWKQTWQVLVCGLVWGASWGALGLAQSPGDWPQINGPNRDGVVSAGKLLAELPKQLSPRWTHAVGQGFAGPAVVGERVVIFHRPNQKYLAEALDADTGKVLWSQALPSAYRGGSYDNDGGPKAVPLIEGKQVFLFGNAGNLFCLNLETGEPQWQVNVLEKYRSPQGYFGSGSTPILMGDRLLVNVGGTGAAVVAFDRNTGKEVWRTFEDRASYSSPIAMKLGDRDVAVFVTRLHLIGLDPKDGKLVFKTEFGKRGTTVNAAMPVVLDDHVFVTAAYGIGAKWVKVGDQSAEVDWENDVSYSSQYSTPVYANNAMFGTAGREDFANGTYHCFDPRSGKVLWQRNDFPVGHSYLVGEEILVLDCLGGLHILAADPSGFDERYRTRLFQTKSRAMPALSRGRLFARSNAENGSGELICVKIGEE